MASAQQFPDVRCSCDAQGVRQRSLCAVPVVDNVAHLAAAFNSFAACSWRIQKGAQAGGVDVQLVHARQKSSADFRPHCAHQLPASVSPHLCVRKR